MEFLKQLIFSVFLIGLLILIEILIISSIYIVMDKDDDETHMENAIKIYKTSAIILISIISILLKLLI